MQYDQRRFSFKIRTKKKGFDSSRMPEPMARQEMDTWRYSPFWFYNLIAQITKIFIFYGYLYKVLYSYSGVLNRYPNNLNITWNTVGKDPITNDMFFRRTTGADIMSLLKRNYSIKVFERLNSSLKRKKMSKRTSYIYKMDIFKDYSYPQPFPLDKFLRLPDGSPNQAYLMLGTKGTGK